MATKIEPTIGRVVWFHNGHLTSKAAPTEADPHAVVTLPMTHSAQVAHVHDPVDGCFHVNLGCFDSAGRHYHAVNVPLIQDGENPPESGHWCEWMPYQKGQAAKQEAQSG